MTQRPCDCVTLEKSELIYRPFLQSAFVAFLLCNGAIFFSIIHNNFLNLVKSFDVFFVYIYYFGHSQTWHCKQKYD